MEEQTSLQEVKKNIKTDEKFQSLISPLSEKDYSILELSILRDGCRDPLVVWKETNILLDGHNRYKICKDNDKDYNIVTKSFEDETAAKKWVRINQFARRSLTSLQKDYQIGSLYNDTKQKLGGDKKSDKAKSNGQSDQLIDDPRNTHEKIAMDLKVSPSTVRRAGQFAEAIDTIAKKVGNGFKEQILSKKVSFSRKDIDDMAGFEPDEIKRVIDSIGKEEVDPETKEKKRINPSDVVKEILFESKELPEEKYDVILANQSWKANETVLKKVNDKYSKDAVVFLWVNNANLSQGITRMKDIMKFNYKNCMAWIVHPDRQEGAKFSSGCDYYKKGSHDLLLVGIKGSMIKPSHKEPFSYLFDQENSGEDHRSEYIYSMIEKMYPKRRYLEFDAKKPRDGWTTIPLLEGGNGKQPQGHKEKSEASVGV